MSLGEFMLWCSSHLTTKIWFMRRLKLIVAVLL
jgi:hypothetical protein